ncbi:hypothetical protein T440DRAFT_13673 [Plenodomus tracheiphilus IPT5]|uniref:Uncharacterized protein n=1 Tax=Plenodomus tracheiphilus IPT5 TaxID=1408161 RepID=A0A6A7BQA6_9PLEO|nr:hypothetical protein T440DRAFT_13673 [Plenodomus tracheiphilus IPT5]
MVSIAGVHQLQITRLLRVDELIASAGVRGCVLRLMPHASNDGWRASRPSNVSMALRICAKANPHRATSALNTGQSHQHSSDITIPAVIHRQSLALWQTSSHFSTSIDMSANTGQHWACYLDTLQSCRFSMSEASVPICFVQYSRRILPG